MKISFKILFIFFTILLVSCGPSDEDKARVKLNYAKTLLAKNDTTKALLHLDSIPKLYPEAMYSINAAKNMVNEIRFDAMHRKEAELDSVLLLIEALEKSFIKEKTQFDRYTQYIHKRQTFDRAWDRSYIKVHLDERGDIALSSNYHGEQWLNHIGLRVYDSGDDAKTETIPLEDVNNHRSDFDKEKWEKVTYRDGKDNGVIEFIANNTERRLKAVFLGNKQHFIILETYDKEAVRDALALSKALRKKLKLEAEINNLQSKLRIN